MKRIKLWQFACKAFRPVSTNPIQNKVLYFHSLGQPSTTRPQINCSVLYSENVLKVQERGYAKSKDKVKGGKQIKGNIADEEFQQIVDVEKYKKELDLVFEHLKEEYVNSLSIRTSLGALENIPVELEGEKYSLNEIAHVIRKSPTMVVINATEFPQASANIRKAIEESGMNLNPQQDGTTIYIPIPKVTKEYREGLAHSAKTLYEKSKSHIKEIQNKYVKKLRTKNGNVSDDLLFNAQLKVQKKRTSISVADCQNFFQCDASIDVIASEI